MTIKGSPSKDTNDGGIVRVVKDALYFVASNEPFNDTRISWETRGLMGYLLSKPNDWQIRMADLLKKGPAKGFKLRRMLAEARYYGYVTRVRYSNPDGTFTWVSLVYESPSLNPNPTKGFIKAPSSTRKSTTGQAASTRLPTCGKPRDIVIPEELNTHHEEEGIKGLSVLPGLLLSKLTILFDPMTHGILTILPAYTQRPAEFVIGHIAKVYHDRSRLNRPIGVLAHRLKLDDPPHDYYIANYAKILPSDYLESVGLALYTCDECSAEFSKRAEYADHILTHYKDPAPIPQEDDPPIAAGDETITADIRRAWVGLIDQFKTEMLRSPSLGDYLNPTYPVHYDSDCLTIRAEDLEAAEWLNSRIKRSAERLLVGILKREVCVIFSE